MIDRANLKLWLETEFREALRNDERILIATATLAVCHARGDSAGDAMRMAIIGFVRELVDPLGVAAGLFEQDLARMQQRRGA